MSSAPARQSTSAAQRAWIGSGRIDTGDDIARVLAAVTTASRGRDRTAEFDRAVTRADNVLLDEPDPTRIVPVAPEIAEVLPWPGGLRRGATVAATGSTSLLWALLADAMAHGSWAAVVGMPALGVGVAVEYGVDPTRLALVPDPGERWPTVVSALIDGVDIVIVATTADVPAGAAQALSARARRRGCVLVPTRAWAGCDVTLEVVEQQWHGIGRGRGRLRSQEVTVRASGRGRAERPRRVSTLLPPPSVAARVGPLPGQIPNAPIIDPTEIHESVPVNIRSSRPRRVEPADPWPALLSGVVPEGWADHQRAG